MLPMHSMKSGHITNYPIVEREGATQRLRSWLEGEPSTLAMFRNSFAERNGQPGIFSPLGTTKIVAIEQDGGLRDGHEYWRHGLGWTIHLRWYGLHWVFLHLQRRYDDANLREILEKGEVLFDKVGLAQPLSTLARRSTIHMRLSGRETYHFRTDIADALESLRDLYAMTTGAIKDEHLAGLFEVHFTLSKIAERIARVSERSTSIDISARLGRAGRSRADFGAAVTTLEELAERLLKILGGPPRREFYAPANAVLCMPPDESGRERTEPIAQEDFLCTACSRRFVLPLEQGQPTLVHDPASAPAITPAPSHTLP